MKRKKREGIKPIPSRFISFYLVLLVSSYIIITKIFKKAIIYMPIFEKWENKNYYVR